MIDHASGGIELLEASWGRRSGLLADVHVGSITSTRAFPLTSAATIKGTIRITFPIRITSTST